MAVAPSEKGRVKRPFFFEMLMCRRVTSGWGVWAVGPSPWLRSVRQGQRLLRVGCLLDVHHVPLDHPRLDCADQFHFVQRDAQSLAEAARR